MWTDGSEKDMEDKLDGMVNILDVGETVDDDAVVEDGPAEVEGTGALRA